MAERKNPGTAVGVLFLVSALAMVVVGIVGVMRDRGAALLVIGLGLVPIAIVLLASAGKATGPRPPDA